MWTVEAASKGAKAKAKKIRDAYIANPNLCRECQDPILPKEGQSLPEVRIKKFCSKSCAAKHNNVLAKTPKRRKQIRPCINCGGPAIASQSKYCDECREALRETLLNKRKDEVGRTAIATHARNVTADRDKSCARCGYTHFVDVCHIRSVSSFPKDALVREINSQDNLILLCPNCHHEYDAHLFMIPWRGRQVV